MDTPQWPQEIVVKPLEEIVTSTCPKPRWLQPPQQPAASAAMAEGGGGGGGERKVRPQKDQALNCPRCNSTNTKFCYYNNYSLTQPRYFCKTCRRYWTEGGSLRNIPVGGGSRKNKRSSSFSSPSCSNSPSNSAPPPPKKRLSDHHHHQQPISITPPGLTGQNPKFHETQDLNLSFPHGFRSNFTELIQNVGNNNSSSASNKNPLLVSSWSASSATATASIAASQHVSSSAMDLLSNNGNSFMDLPVHHHHQDPSGFAMQDHYKPSTTTLLGFSLEGFHHHHHLGGHVHQEEGVSGRLLFPFEDLKLPVSPTSTTNVIVSDNDQKHAGDAASTGYWTGMLSGGSW